MGYMTGQFMCCLQLLTKCLQGAHRLDIVDMKVGMKSRIKAFK